MARPSALSTWLLPTPGGPLKITLRCASKDKLTAQRVQYGINAAQGKVGPGYLQRVQDGVQSLNNAIATIGSEAKGDRMSSEGKEYARRYIQGLSAALDHVRAEFESQGVGNAIDWSASKYKQ